MHYYKFEIAKWNAETAHLLPEEAGVYLKLVNFYYSKEKPIPLDLRPVLRKLILTAYEEIALNMLQEFFKKTKKGWIHGFCDKNIAYVTGNAEISRINGRKGGRPKGSKNPELTEKEPSRNPAGTQQVTSGVPRQKALHDSTTLLLQDNGGSYATTVSFSEFWEVYPRDRRRDKKGAAKIWNRRKLDRLGEIIIADVKNRIEHDSQWKQGFVPMPTTYLNGDRWEDAVSDHKTEPDFGQGGV